MIRAPLFLLVVLFLSACGDPGTVRLSTKSTSLAATATLSTSVSKFRIGGAKISAQLEVENISAKPQPYSNRWLWLRGSGDFAARAWFDNIVIHPADESEIEIQPGETFKISIYWVFPESIGNSVLGQPLSLELQPDD